MAKILGEVLFAAVRAFVAGWAYSFMLKIGAWLDTKIEGRNTNGIKV